MARGELGEYKAVRVISNLTPQESPESRRTPYRGCRASIRPDESGRGVIHPPQNNPMPVGRGLASPVGNDKRTITRAEQNRETRALITGRINAGYEAAC